MLSVPEFKNDLYDDTNLSMIPNEDTLDSNNDQLVSIDFRMQHSYNKSPLTVFCELTSSLHHLNNRIITLKNIYLY